MQVHILLNGNASIPLERYFWFWIFAYTEKIGKKFRIRSKNKKMFKNLNIAHYSLEKAYERLSKTQLVTYRGNFYELYGRKFHFQIKIFYKYFKEKWKSIHSNKFGICNLCLNKWTKCIKFQFSNVFTKWFSGWLPSIYIYKICRRSYTSYLLIFSFT